ncbi:hydrogenase nickel incorporation protein HypB [Mycobacterium sp.]|uniref:hydrogenase nickel incorporation protein HypB n=1 Tax=Mycobacterium sp. TaxID=1785 RepID=UPI002BDF6D52|nr:hydrogenase nickel incorporation protein HypB [Mycobacterium sp.]HME47914.1 hydrogenase nickel incorporation protein HypB [Mycobacterium sp.]
MCATCGCGDDGAVITLADETGQTHADGHHHHHDHDHGHDHPPATETISLEQKVLAKNDLLAQQNRRWLAERNILAFNVTSSPGAGKTTLLERTIRELGVDRPVAVIEGDQETLLDAQRIAATGCRVVQVNTGAGCHLDADMIHRALETLDPQPDSLLFVENVGNLVCPALFDLGEQTKVVVISVTEGADKPLKYPHMFAAAGLVLINKTDLLPYVDFDLDICARHARSINPKVEILPLSATTGEGVERWYAWIDARANDFVELVIDKSVGWE